MTSRHTLTLAAALAAVRSAADLTAAPTPHTTPAPGGTRRRPARVSQPAT
jgi:hypothetical protein